MNAIPLKRHTNYLFSQMSLYIQLSGLHIQEEKAFMTSMKNCMY